METQFACESRSTQASRIASSPGDLPDRPSRPKVLLVEDYQLVRLGIKAFFERDDGSPIDWLEASTLHDALALLAAHPDIALVMLDLNLTDSRGLNGLSRITQACPDARVLILSGTQDEFVVRQATAMGAVGYLHKGEGPDAMQAALAEFLGLDPVDGGGGPGSARAGMKAKGRPGKSKLDCVADLGPRHLDILELVLSGCTNHEISQSTALSLGTVKNYVSTILMVLDVKSRAHLISLFR